MAVWEAGSFWEAEFKNWGGEAEIGEADFIFLFGHGDGVVGVDADDFMAEGVMDHFDSADGQQAAGPSLVWAGDSDLREAGLESFSKGFHGGDFAAFVGSRPAHQIPS